MIPRRAVLRAGLAAAGSALAGCAAPVARWAAEGAPEDLWLEDPRAEATRAWIAARNAESEARLRGDPRYAIERARFLAQRGAQHSEEYLNGGIVHRIAMDAAHPLGLWQGLAVSDAARAFLGDGWQTLLDLDALAAREGVRWKFPLWWKNPMGDPRLGPRCLVNLSPDGGDRTVLREFDLAQRRFVDGGFRIDRPARTYVHWVDRDHVLVATDFGPGTLSAAGYAREARLWRRGTPLAEAAPVFAAAENAVLFIPHNFSAPGGRTLFVAEVWHRDAGAPGWWWMRPGDTPRPIRPPVALVRYRGLAGLVGGRLVALTAEPMAAPDGGPAWPAGSLIALPPPDAPGGGTIEPIYRPAEGEAIDPVFHLAVAEDALWFGVMHDVSGRLLQARRGDAGWAVSLEPVPPHGAVRLSTGEIAPSAVLVRTESLTQPPESTVRGGGRPPRPIGRAPASPDLPEGRIVSEQRFATSRDGTRIPYYLLRPRDHAFDGRGAALVTAYGGFGISFLPAYLNAEFQSDLAATMLAAGAIHVHANIRGGGEYGPAWHRAAQRRDHARGIEDLIAVAEDVVRSGAADRTRLGFIGASNGGLLAAATAVRRPDLFRAVVADVPLTDMLRFHELFTGAVWIDEYGDPRDPADRAALAAYSPLQQLRAGVAYPEMLITTSSSDDRVHPGHARRFAERLRQLGQPVLFHESTDAGHGGAAALDSAAAARALQATYLLQALGVGGLPGG